MHYQRSVKAQRALKIGACHFLFNILLAITALGGVVYGAYTIDQQTVYIGVALSVAWILSVVLFFAKGGGLKCSLCMNPVWGGKKCQKHSKVKPALGLSYRLGTACSIAFKGKYRCPYCGEPFSVQHGTSRRRGSVDHRMQRSGTAS